jgi:hypothetical protein
MWFNVQAALAGIEGGEKPLLEPVPRATRATSATQAPATLSRVAHVAHVAHPPALKSESTVAPDCEAEIFEERAAICEMEGCLPRADAEALASLHLPNLAADAGIDEASMARVIDLAARRLDRLRKRGEP